MWLWYEQILNSDEALLFVKHLQISYKKKPYKKILAFGSCASLKWKHVFFMVFLYGYLHAIIYFNQRLRWYFWRFQTAKLFDDVTHIQNVGQLFLNMTCSKNISVEIRSLILKLSNDGSSWIKIASTLGMSRSTVGNILRHIQSSDRHEPHK